MSIAPSAIDAFSSAQSARSANAAANETREAVMELLLSPGADDVRRRLFQEPTYGARWRRVHEALDRAFAEYRRLDGELGSSDLVKVERRGGRGTRYDFEAWFVRDGAAFTRKLEFKLGTDLYAYPQMLQLYARPGVVVASGETSFAEYFYDHYVGDLEALAGVAAPSRDDYLRRIYGTTYSIHPFFERLYAQRATNQEQRKRIADRGIDAYLHHLVSRAPASLDLAGLEEAFLEQADKIFILWDPSRQAFRLQRLPVSAMTLDGSVSLKVGTTGLATSLRLGSVDGGHIDLLLRWKNNAAILGPGWQIRPASPHLP